MSLYRILATVGLSLGAAISAGIYAAPERPEAALRPAPGPATASLGASTSLIPSAPSSAAEPGASIAAFLPEPAPAGLDPAPTGPQPLDTAGLSATDAAPADCAIDAQLSALPAAMLSLVLHAPCDAGEPVAIGQGALLLAQPLGPDGRLELALPALRADAGVTLAMADGRTVQLTARVPDFDLYQRVVVGWTGPAVLDLHAFAGGAGWNEPGHVRAGGPVSAVTGFVQAFGDADPGGQQTRIYTYPVGIGAASGHVAIEANLAVTAETCGRPFVARVTAILGAAATRQRQIEVAMPDCGGPVGFIAIPDLLPLLDQPDPALIH